MVAEHNVVRILGGSPGGEVWSINPRFYHPSGTPVVNFADLQTWANAIAALNAGAVFPTDIRNLYSLTGNIRGVRVEYIDASGNIAQAAESLLSTPSAGLTSLSKPLQTSVVVSLLTGRPGRSFRGRLYLPYWGSPTLLDTGRIAGTARTAIGNAIAAWLDAVGDAAPIGGGMQLVVVSQTIGIASRVTSLQVGDVPDTQRRRRDALVEARTTFPFPPA